MPLPLVAIVGRPNVGKSTFVNRLAGERTAIVHDEAGVTRDRLYRPAEWGGRSFRVVDTGGLVFEDDSEFLPEIRAQAAAAIAEAQAVILVVDGQMGPTAADIEIANWLRQRDLPIAIAANKCESVELGIAQAAAFWELGLGEPIPCSSIHGNGVAEVLEVIVPLLPEAVEEEGEEPLNIAIVGRPNVGKSSLLNRLAGEQRTIVSDVAGTTRDAIDTQVEHEGKRYRFIDTAGIRKKSRVDYGVEFFSINRAFKAIQRSDVVLFVIDTLDGIGEQDQKLAGRIADEGRACVVVVNKWDAVEKDSQTIYDYTRYVRERLYFVEWASIIFTSALTGQRVNKIFELAERAAESHRRRVSTSVVNEVLEETAMWHSPPTNRQGKQGKIYYGTQVSVQPPTFALFVNQPGLFKDNYRRYVEKQFRKVLSFDGTPIRFVWRGKTERSAERGRLKLEQSR
ncbi:ribosome biogenesis GTPase Der [Synechococcus sp. PCC 7336]|uniref:ribosome biogenesis GTPase Der n=1 Tax=Synechococcus sp. PCC 7336 TaxID=195250 RepID=UPI000347A940|nr:ribosome biogenesis GTPase Der [Synechococcus sp. PCC 7336]